VGPDNQHFLNLNLFTAGFSKGLVFSIIWVYDILFTSICLIIQATIKSSSTWKTEDFPFPRMREYQRDNANARNVLEQKVVMIKKDSQIQKEQLSAYSEEEKNMYWIVLKDWKVKN
jgi:hypothetical protein